jgi:hypothetical protein
VTGIAVQCLEEICPMTKEENAEADTLSELFDRGRISHLHAGFHPVNAQFEFAIGTLPYPPSNGPWLERLCFLLLRSQGYVPRYFGNVGQKDRGVDLLVTTGDQLFVYQCRNVQSFSPGDMLRALKDFEDEWLKSSGLPKPNKFILCCPSLLRERLANEEWTKLERDFRSRTGVEVEYWHRNYLDETLKFMPDIVAEAFSDQIVKLFCECDDWNYDQFAPVIADSHDRYIKRYQDRKSTDRIYVDPDVSAQFTEKVERNGSVLIMGLPGSGKTTTSFALAEALPNRRTYYVTLRETISDNDLVSGVKRRLARQTIFLVVFTTFDEVAHCVNLLCRLTPAKQKESLDVFFRFVDEGKPVYSDPEYLRSVRSLFSTLATPNTEPEDARKLLNLGNASAVAPMCSKATTLDLFLYLWGLYVLWFEWESAQGKSFVEFLNAEIREAVIASLPKRFATAKQDKETGNLIKLTGLLSFVGVPFARANAVKDFLSRLGSFDKMIDDLDEDQTFIPSVFYLLGLEWLYQKDRGVPAVVWWDELGKAHDYTKNTAALDYVRSIVSKRSRAL